MNETLPVKDNCAFSFWCIWSLCSSRGQLERRGSIRFISTLLSIPRLSQWSIPPVSDQTDGELCHAKSYLTARLMLIEA